MSGIFISTVDFSKLSKSAKDEILALVTKGHDGENLTYEEDDQPIDLSSAQAIKVVRGLSDKSRLVLKTILEIDETGDGFWVNDVADKLGIEVSELTGVWSGLTRRIRTVTGEPEAYLFNWAWDEDKQDNYGSLHKITFKNCKKALNI
ncbi:hypothetical protein [Xenorhabdus bovienii]|uniref:hypothetical protein n=1 Tax=Xenorhabdus bovienii TaxID=40576 RepID=UPI0023B264E0|nr:hypothetical protein [Xenorhabdus bovienii]MDE9543844.1 hypothetical protein [Xenorhabdus bovienii]MDE9570985.1 hypothetical protein [Xenorhabdus bovienii]